MGWMPQPRWDGRRYRVKINKKTYSLGTDHAEAHRRFARLYRQITGLSPRGQTLDTANELIEAWQHHHGTPFARQMLQPFSDHVAGRLIEDLDRDVLTDYHAALLRDKGRLSPWTLVKYLGYPRRVLAWAKAEELIDFDPVRLRRILKALDARKQRRPVARLIRFILATGCRPGEARMLRWDHVNMDAAVCQLPPDEHKTGRRTGTVRTIYLSADALAILRDLDAIDHTPAAYVFVSHRGTPYTRDGFRAICKRLGFYPYQLRHTAAQTWVDGGADLGTVGAALGHRSSDTTRKYAEVRDRRVFAMFQQLESSTHSPSDGGPPGPDATAPPAPAGSASAQPARRRGGRSRPTPKTRTRRTGRGRRSG